MKIYIGNDHTGVAMKNSIMFHLKNRGLKVINLGTDTTDPVDYPDIGQDIALNVAADEESVGIAICGSGIGISIATNKVKGIRAALCYEEKAAELARMHNDANIIALGSRFIAVEKAISIVDKFLEIDFEKDRHTKRVIKLNKI